MMSTSSKIFTVYVALMQIVWLAAPAWSIGPEQAISTPQIPESIVTEMVASTTENIIVPAKDETIPLVQPVERIEQKEIVETPQPVVKSVSTASPTALDSDVEVEDSAYTVESSVLDRADLGDGKFAYRLYETPRLTYEEDGVLKLRARGWNWFDQMAGSHLSAQGENGYVYTVPVGEKSSVTVSQGAIDLGVAGETLVPQASQFSQTVRESGETVTTFANSYPQIDIRFQDATWWRNRSIILQQVPTGIKEADTVIVWEQYVLPTDAVVLDEHDKEFADGDTIASSYVSIQIPNSERLMISPATMFDAALPGDDSLRQDLAGVGIEQTVRLDRDGHRLAIGLRVPAKYLLDPVRVYPVTIDPLYLVCSPFGGVGGTTCDQTVFYIRAQDGGADNTTALTPSVTNNTLFLGRWFNSADNRNYTRHPVLHFKQNDFQQLFSGQTVDSASLFLYYSNIGFGNATRIASAVKRITRNDSVWPTSNPGTNFTYSNLRGFLTNENLPLTIARTSTYGWYNWDIGPTVRQWQSGTDNLGVVVEDTDAWPSGTTPPASWNDLLLHLDSPMVFNQGPYLEIRTTVVQSGQGPDLSVLGISAPGTITAGSAVTTFATIQNTGTVGTGSFTTKTFLSTQSNCSSEVSGTATFPFIASLGAGSQVNTSNSSLVVPATTTPGTYYVCYVADSNSNVVESNEQNNTLAQSSLIVAGIQSDSLEPNDTFAQAYYIGATSTYTNLNLTLTPGDQDYFRFRFNNVDYYIKVQNVSNSTAATYALRLTIANGNFTVETFNMSVGVNAQIYLYGNGQNQLAFTNFYDGVSMHIEYQYPLIVIVPDSLEPNNDFIAATNLGTNTSYTNNFVSLTSGDEDNFRFTYDGRQYYVKVTQGNIGTNAGNYGFQFSIANGQLSLDTVYISGSVDTQLSLYNNNATQVAFNDDAVGRFSHISYTFPVANDLYAFDTITDEPTGPKHPGDVFYVYPAFGNNNSTPANGIQYHIQLVDTISGAIFIADGQNPTTVNLPANSESRPQTVASIPANIVLNRSYRVQSVIDYAHLFNDPVLTNNTATDMTRTPIFVAAGNYSGGWGTSGNGTTASQIASVFHAGTSTPRQLSFIDSPLVLTTYSTTPDRRDAVVAVGDPINARTGAFEFTENDLQLPGRGADLNLTRVYNSRNIGRSNRFGNGWDFSFNMYLYYDSTTGAVNVYKGSSLAARFTSPDNGITFVPMLGDTDTLSVQGSNYTLKTLDGVSYLFTQVGTSDGLRIVSSVTDRNGNTTALTYMTRRDVPLLSALTDAAGRSYTVTYGSEDGDTWDKIIRIEDTNTTVTTYRTLEYGYDAALNLTNVTTTDRTANGVTLTAEQFVPDTSNRLWQYIDSRGTILYNTYDADGRTIKQEEYNPLRDAAGSRRILYDIVYTGADVAIANSAHCTAITNYLDSTSGYTEHLCWNANELRISDARGGVQGEHILYNTDGMVESVVDGNGYTTTYTYDSHRRKTRVVLPDTATYHTETIYTYATDFDKPSTVCDHAVRLDNANAVTDRCSTFVVNATNGNIESATDSLGHTETFTYDTYGNVLTHTDKRGTATAYQYDVTNNYPTSVSTTVHVPDGTTQTIVHTYAYDAFGRKTADCAPGITCTTFTYDSLGRLQHKILSPTFGVDYTYDEEGHLVTEVDSTGATVRYTYDRNIYANPTERLIVGRNGTPDIATYKEYYDEGKLKAEIDALGHRTTYTYDVRGNVYTKTLPTNAVTTYTYDANNNLYEAITTGIDILNERIVYSYDSRNNLTEVRKYLDTTNYISERNEYDGFGRKVRTIDSRSNATQYVYDNGNRLTAMTDALNGLTTYTYDENANKTCEILPNAQTNLTLRNTGGCSTSYEYDEANRLIHVTNADNKDTVTTYTEASNITSVVDRQNANGSAATHTTRYLYDTLGNRTRTTFADGSTAGVGYDVKNRMVSSTDQFDHVTRYTYDDLNRVTTITDPVGNVTRYGYDVAGNNTSIIYPDTTAVTYGYDVGNRLTSVIDTQSGVHRYDYDVLGNKISDIDKNIHATTFTYDALSRLVSETNATGTVSTYVYDGNNNRLSETTNGKVRSWTYDPLNRVTFFVDRGKQVENNTYDANGNVISTIDGNTQTIGYVYDGLNRAIRKDLPGIASDVVYSYDNWGNVINITEGLAVTFTGLYDMQNRLQTETRRIPQLSGTRTFTITRIYRPDGSLASLTDAAGKVILYNYDTRNLLDTVTYNGTTLADYTNNAMGKPIDLVYSNGTHTTYAYDTLNRLTTMEVKNAAGASLTRQDYQYDAESNRTRLTDDASRTIDYTYDVLNQLASTDYSNISSTGPDVQYGYDAWGNRSSLVTPLGPVAYTVASDSNELQTVSRNNGLLNQTFTYDGNGAMASEQYTRLGTSVRRVDYAFDVQGRLSGLTYTNQTGPTTAPNTLAFAYSDDGNRVGKGVNGVWSYTLNNGLTALDELDAAGAVTKTMVRGLDAIAEIDGAGNIQFIHTDALGSAIMITDNAGAIAGRYEYDAFGQIVGADGTAESKYLFTGQEFDPESELTYMNARYYNADLGRFISRDPMLGRVGDLMSRNGYVYVHNNPLKYTDPSGEFIHIVIGAVVGAVIGVAGTYISNTIEGTDGTWQQYIGATTGGALAGGLVAAAAPLIAAAGLGVGAVAVIGAASGAIGGAVSNLTNVGLDKNKDFNSDDLSRDVIFGSIGGAIPGGKIVGSSLRAFEAIEARAVLSTGKGLLTKLGEGTISQLSVKSTLKVSLVTAVDSLGDIIVGSGRALYNRLNDTGTGVRDDRSKNQFFLGSTL